MPIPSAARATAATRVRAPPLVDARPLVAEARAHSDEDPQRRSGAQPAHGRVRVRGRRRAAGEAEQAQAQQRPDAGHATDVRAEARVQRAHGAGSGGGGRVPHATRN
jgi:hypothetical protein